MPGSFVLHFDKKTNIRKGVLLKYRSFIKFWETPILQGRIHGAKLPDWSALLAIRNKHF